MPAHRPLVVVLALAAPTALATGASMEVTAEARWPLVLQGGEQQARCHIENVGSAPFVAHASVHVTYADGARQDVLRHGHPVELNPTDLVTYMPRFRVPADAAPGVATLTCTGHASAAEGGRVDEEASTVFLVAGAPTAPP